MTHMIIQGQQRHVGGWKPAAMRMRGWKPPGIDVNALPMAHVIDGIPLDYDQGQTSSCGPNALAEMYEHDFTRDGQRAQFSRLFVYFFVRCREGDLLEDDGVTIPDLISVASTMGMPLERSWPLESKLLIVPPTPQVLGEAQMHRVQRADLVVDLDHLLAEIAADQPVLLGFGVPQSMASDETARTGVVNVPSATDPLVGGHAVLAHGFDRANRLVKCTCHYGTGFGDSGAIHLPFDHWSRGNVSDMTAIRSIS